MDEKRKRGRPSNYRPDFCDRAKAIGAEGASLTEIGVRLGISHQCQHEWAQKHPEFGEALKEARRLSQAWWEQKGREKTFNSEGFNATSYIFQMKNRFPADWRDRVEHSHEGKDGAALFSPELIAAAAKLAKAL